MDPEVPMDWNSWRVFAWRATGESWMYYILYSQSRWDARPQISVVVGCTRWDARPQISVVVGCTRWDARPQISVVVGCTRVDGMQGRRPIICLQTMVVNVSC